VSEKLVVAVSRWRRGWWWDMLAAWPGPLHRSG
jgi:hypothetical protein